MMVMMMMISKLTPPPIQKWSPCTKPWAFIGLSMHKSMGLDPWFLCTRFCMVVSYIIWIWKGNTKNLKHLIVSLLVSLNVFYSGGARFKPYLHPYVCPQMPLGPRLIFIFIGVCVMCVTTPFLPLDTPYHDIHPHETAHPPACAKKKKSDVVRPKVVNLWFAPSLRVTHVDFVPPFWACPFLLPEPSSSPNLAYHSFALRIAMTDCHGSLWSSWVKPFLVHVPPSSRSSPYANVDLCMCQILTLTTSCNPFKCMPTSRSLCDNTPCFPLRPYSWYTLTLELTTIPMLASFFSLDVKIKS